MQIMKRTIILTSLLMLLSTCLLAQKSKSFTVPAGSKVEDCIPFDERYRFPEFTTGAVLFKNGTRIEAKLNYNYLVREMQYLQVKDTLSFANENDILQIVINNISFVINKGFLEVIRDGKVKVGVREYLNLIDVKKKDPYGQIGSGAATDSYGSLHTNGQYYKLIVDQDRLFQKVSTYYLATSSNEFVSFTKKKVIQLFPQQKLAIEDYLKLNKVDFNSRNDLLSFADYLNTL